MTLAKALPLHEASIDGTTKHEDGELSTLAETLPDASAGVADQLLDQEHEFIVAAVVADVFNRLSPRERAITALRFGLGGASPITHGDAGAAVELGALRVTQIEKRALHVLASSVAAGLATLVASPPRLPPERWEMPDGRELELARCIVARPR